MHCAELDRWAQRYYDRELTPAEQHGVDSHLRVCAACHKRFKAIGVTLELVRTSLKMPAPSSDLARRIGLAVRAAAAPPPQPRPAFRWLPGRGMALPISPWVAEAERSWTVHTQWQAVWRLLAQVSHSHYLNHSCPTHA